jgi:hypothetical protein
VNASNERKKQPSKQLSANLLDPAEVPVQINNPSLALADKLSKQFAPNQINNVQQPLLPQ